MVEASPFNKQEFTCTLCLELFKSPVTLSCAHTFCKECLEPIIKDNKIVCPLCREISPMPKGK